MNKEPNYVASHAPYAVDLSEVTYDQGICRMKAVWFRKKNGRVVASIGTLWGHHKSSPGPLDFLRMLTDGRYGGRCEARRDGKSFWSASQDRDEQNRQYEELKRVLETFPSVPSGYDGWWTFKPTSKNK